MYYLQIRKPSNGIVLFQYELGNNFEEINSIFSEIELIEYKEDETGNYDITLVADNEDLEDQELQIIKRKHRISSDNTISFLHFFMRPLEVFQEDLNGFVPEPAEHDLTVDLEPNPDTQTADIKKEKFFNKTIKVFFLLMLSIVSISSLYRAGKSIHQKEWMTLSSNIIIALACVFLLLLTLNIIPKSKFRKR